MVLAGAARRRHHARKFSCDGVAERSGHVGNRKGAVGNCQCLRTSEVTPDA